MMNKATRGRRPGKPETRERILAIARRRFLADGYHAVTMRSIAAQAGVDVALISYFFGSKQGVFGAALDLAAAPARIVEGALDGDLETLSERLLRALLSTWDDPARGAPLRALVRAAGGEPGVRRLLSEAVQHEMVQRIAARLGGAGAHARAAALSVQLAGVIFTRYVLAVDPIATMPADELIQLLAPSLRATLRPPPFRPPGEMISVATQIPPLILEFRSGRRDLGHEGDRGGIAAA